MARPRTISDEAIASTARALFLSRGPAVSTQVIADELGVSQAALFKRVRTKEQLLLSALAPADLRAMPWFTDLKEGPAAYPGLTSQLRTLGVGLDSYFRQLVPSLVMLRASGLSLEKLVGTGPAPVLEVETALTDWFRRAQKMEKRPGRPSSRAHTFLSAIEARCFREYIMGPKLVPDASTHCHELVEVIWP